jgi:HK97 family phage major capsid protein
MAFSANDAKLSQTGDTMFEGYLDPEQAQDYFAEAEKTSIVQQVATKIPMGPTGVKIPHWTGDVTASWVGEAEMKPITKGNLSKQTVVPHKIATIFTASAEVVRSNPAGYLNTMRTKVATAIAMAFDNAALHGTNSPFSAYLAQTTKQASLGPNAYTGLAVDTLGLLVNDGKKWNGTLLDDVAEPVINASVDANGRPLFVESTYDSVVTPFRPGRVIGRQTIISDHVADGDIVGFAGDFSQIVWGQVGGLSYSVSNEATINYGTEISPNLISLWQHNLVAVLVEAEYGLLINDVASFVKLTAEPLPQTFTVTLANGSSGETFTLKVNGVATGTIAFDATNATVKTAIVAVDDSILAADVTVTGSAGGPYTVTLPAALTHGTDSGDLVSTIVPV